MHQASCDSWQDGNHGERRDRGWSRRAFDAAGSGDSGESGPSGARRAVSCAGNHLHSQSSATVDRDARLWWARLPTGRKIIERSNE